jgi:hypothetical protein
MAVDSSTQGALMTPVEGILTLGLYLYHFCPSLSGQSHQHKRTRSDETVVFPPELSEFLLTIIHRDLEVPLSEVAKYIYISVVHIAPQTMVRIGVDSMVMMLA